MAYLLVCLARDILAFVGWVSSPRKQVNVKKVEKPSTPCEFSSTPTVKEVYFLQGPGHKVHFNKNCVGKTSEMKSMEVCKKCLARAGSAISMNNLQRPVLDVRDNLSIASDSVLHGAGPRRHHNSSSTSGQQSMQSFEDQLPVRIPWKTIWFMYLAA
eukprot:s374_g59.t1